MRNSTGSLMVGLALALALSGPAEAALVEVDLFAPGDKLVTRDTAAGLEWLDVDQTTSLSVDSILGGAGGWDLLGFSHATTAQVNLLFVNADIPLINAGFQSANFPTVTALQALVGTLSGGVATVGAAGVNEPAANRSYLPTLEHQVIAGTAQAKVPNNFTVSNGAISSNVGHWLVRTSVPEPSSVCLLLATLGALTLRCRTARAS